MVVIGIDFGEKFCVVSRKSGTAVNIVLNDYNERKTHSYVSFVENKREFGVSAKNLQAANIGSTFDGLKKMMSKITETGKGNSITPPPLKLDFALFAFKYRDESVQFNSIQLLAMLLSELKSYAEAELNSEKKPWERIHVTGCAISVPTYFSSYSQKALLMAAGVAGLSVKLLVRETTAVALAYSHHKKFPKPINVAFVDMGHIATQICIWKFTGRSFEVLSEVSEEIGGKDMDERIASHFMNKEELENKQLGPYFKVKFMDEVEVLKCKMSSDTIAQKLNIGLLLNDESAELLLDRLEMEKICEDLFERIRTLMEKSLQEAKIAREDIDSVQIVGGSTRIPKVQEVIQEVFGKSPESTMNKDEAVAKGCLIKLDFAESNIALSEGQHPQNIPIRSERSITICEMHPNFCDNKKDCLLWTREDFRDYKKREKSLKAIDQQEKERGFMRNKLDELQTSEKAMFADDDCRYPKCELEKLHRMNTESTEFYQDKLDELSSYVEQEKERKRCEARDNFLRFIKALPKGEKSFDQKLRSDLHHLKGWTNGSKQEYEKKLDEWKQTARLEEERCEARNRLISFTRKERESLDKSIVLKSIVDQLEELENWFNGTTEEYTMKLGELEQALSKEKHRLKSFSSFQNFIRALPMEEKSFDQKLRSDLHHLKGWTNGSKQEYEKKLDEWKQTARLEEERCEARNRLISFTRKVRGSLDKSIVLKGIVDRLEELGHWFNGTTEEYTMKLEEVKQVLVKESERVASDVNLRDFINTNDTIKTLAESDPGIRSNVNKINSWKNGSIEEYEEELAAWKKLVSEESERLRCRSELLEFINCHEKAENSTSRYLYKRHMNDFDFLKTVENGSTSDYTTVLKHWQTYLKHEQEKATAREALFSFIEEEEGKANGLLVDIVDSKLERVLQTVKASTEESAEFYDKAYATFKDYAEKEKRRRYSRKSLLEFINKLEQSSPNICFTVIQRQELNKMKRSLRENTEFYHASLQWCKDLLAEETDRTKAREALFSFIEEEGKATGLLVDIVDSNMAQKLQQIKVSQGESLEFYVNALKTLKDYASQENVRRTCRQTLIEFIEKLEKSWPEIFSNSSWKQELNTMKLASRENTEYFQKSLKRCEQIMAEETDRIKARQDLLDFIETQELIGAFPEFPSSDFAIELRVARASKHENRLFYESFLNKFRSIVDDEKLRKEASRTLVDYTERPIFKNTDDVSVKRELERFRSFSNGSKEELQKALTACVEIEKGLWKRQNARQKVMTYKENLILSCQGEEGLESEAFNNILISRLTTVEVPQNESVDFYEAAFEKCRSINEEEEIRHKDFIKLLQFFNDLAGSSEALLDFYVAEMKSEHVKIQTWFDGSSQEYQKSYSIWSDKISQESQRIEARQKLISYFSSFVGKLEDKLTSDQNSRLDESYKAANETTAFYTAELEHWKNIVLELSRKTVPSVAKKSLTFFSNYFIQRCQTTIKEIKENKNSGELIECIDEIESFLNLSNDAKINTTKLERLLEDCLQSLKDYVHRWVYLPYTLKTFKTKFEALKKEVEFVKTENQKRLNKEQHEDGKSHKERERTSKKQMSPWKQT